MKEETIDRIWLFLFLGMGISCDVLIICEIFDANFLVKMITFIFLNICLILTLYIPEINYPARKMPKEAGIKQEKITTIIRKNVLVLFYSDAAILGICLLIYLIKKII